eukprot:4346793-Prymnesium_polylepis.1
MWHARCCELRAIRSHPEAGTGGFTSACSQHPAALHFSCASGVARTSCHIVGIAPYPALLTSRTPDLTCPTRNQPQFKAIDRIPPPAPAGGLQA